MTSALILPQRRIASRAAACIWLTSGLPNSPLTLALMIGPDASIMVHAMGPPPETGESESRVAFSPARGPARSGFRIPELYVHALPRDAKRAPFDRGHEVHHHAFLILDR